MDADIRQNDYALHLNDEPTGKLHLEQCNITHLKQLKIQNTK